MKKALLILTAVMFLLAGCAKHYQRPTTVKASEPVKEEIKPPLTVKATEQVKKEIKSPPTIYYNFKTASQAQTPLATIAVIPENWPYDKEDDMTYGALTTELIQQGFHIVYLNNLYDQIESKYLQLGYYNNLFYKKVKEKMKVDAVLIYESTGATLGKTSFRLVDSGTSEILVAGSYILKENITDEIVFKAVANEVSKVYKYRVESERSDFNLGISDYSAYYEFKTQPTPKLPLYSLTVLNSSWPEKKDAYTFEKKNLVIAELMKKNIRVYDENLLYYGLFDKIVDYNFKQIVFFDSTHVLFGKYRQEKSNASFLNKLQVSEISKILPVDGLFLYDIKESKSRFNYQVVSINDGKVLSSSSVNIPKYDFEEKLIAQTVREMSDAVVAKNKVINTATYLNDDTYFYEGSTPYKDITDKMKEYERLKSAPPEPVKPVVTFKQKDVYEYEEVFVKPELKIDEEALKVLFESSKKYIKQQITVIVSYIVTKDGKTSNIVIDDENNPNYITKQAISSFVKQLKYNPGKDTENNPVKVRIKQWFKIE